MPLWLGEEVQEVLHGGVNRALRSHIQALRSGDPGQRAAAVRDTIAWLRSDTAKAVEPSRLVPLYLMLGQAQGQLAEGR